MGSGSGAQIIPFSHAMMVLLAEHATAFVVQLSCGSDIGPVDTVPQLPPTIGTVTVTKRPAVDWPQLVALLALTSEQEVVERSAEAQGLEPVHEELVQTFAVGVPQESWVGNVHMHVGQIAGTIAGLVPPSSLPLMPWGHVVLLPW